MEPLVDLTSDVQNPELIAYSTEMLPKFGPPSMIGVEDITEWR